MLVYIFSEDPSNLENKIIDKVLVYIFFISDDVTAHLLVMFL